MKLFFFTMIQTKKINNIQLIPSFLKNVVTIYAFFFRIVFFQSQCKKFLTKFGKQVVRTCCFALILHQLINVLVPNVQNRFKILIVFFFLSKLNLKREYLEASFYLKMFSTYIYTFMKCPSGLTFHSKGIHTSLHQDLYF